FTGPSTSAWFTSLAFSPDGRRLLTGSWDGRARIWDVETAAELRHFEGDLDAVAPQITAVAFSPDGRLVLAGSHDETVRLWDAETGGERLRLLAQGLVEAVAFSPDGGRLLTGADDAARLWDAGTGEPLRHFEGDIGWVFALAASPDGRHLLTGDVDGVARRWDLETGAEAFRLEAHADQASAVAFSPDGRYLLTGGYDTYARLWDTATGALLRTLEGPSSDDPEDPAGVNAVAFSPDSRYVLTGNQDDTARLWDAETGAELRRFEGHAQWVTSVSFSPDGRLALSAGLDRTARVWDTATGTERRRFDGRGVGYDLFYYATFAPDGRHVLTFGGVPDSTLLWDLETGARLRYFEGHSERVKAATFSADGRLLLTGSDDGTIRLYDVETGEERRRFDVPATWVTAVTFFSDGQYVLAAGDTQTHLFDAATGERVASLVSFTDGTWAVVAPDGRFDTNDLEAVEGLHWVAPDDPLTPLPIEAFMADLYEPRLLPRLLAGEAFPEVRGLLERNRVQPVVAITDVTLAADGTASVTVSVEGLERAYGGATHVSGAHDLRLFRDGQLVAWRDGVLVEGAGTATLTFDGLALPSDADTLTFSAYAFNADRVKSRTTYAG